MNIRWRVGILGMQLLVLGSVAQVVVGRPVVAETWYFAGLLAVVVNPLLLEPWYARPQDVLANALIGGTLYATAKKTITAPGWMGLAIFLGVVGLAALLALVLGAGREEGPGVSLGRSARTLSRIGSAAIIYSAVFWLSALEFSPSLGNDFWLLGSTWAVLLFLGRVNWQAVWATATRAPLPCVPEGAVGPSMLRISGTDLPAPGSPVSVEGGAMRAEGVVMNRIHRKDDTWGEIFISKGQCYDLVRAPALTIELAVATHDIVGAVDVGSTDRVLKFVAPSPMKVGEVVAVEEGGHDVLYQISRAEIERSDVRGGSHLIVRARAAQLGRFNRETGRIERHEWVPKPGHAVRRPKFTKEATVVPDSWMKIGTVLGTSTPVYLDRAAATRGHLTILGMTRMGKTSFAVQLAAALAEKRSVLIMDQTGEYVGKRGLPAFAEGDEDSPSLTVIEPKPGQTPAERALSCLKWLVEKATEEYKADDLKKRVLLLEEAHQFVPEPAGLGFGAPGRKEAYEFGLLMMQIRKYGLSAILISQRTAVVAKSALSQCENIIAFKSVDQTGLDYLQALMGEEARALLPRLRQGQALAFGPAISVENPVVIDVIRPGTIDVVPILGDEEPALT